MILGPADGWPQGNQQLTALATALLQLADRLENNPTGHPAPTGMAGRDLAGAGIRQQHRGAVGTADPQALTARIGDQAIGVGPRF